MTTLANAPAATTKKKNAFILVLDSLRFDTVENLDHLRRLAPNLHRLAERSVVGRVITNAQSTQFVMPALFTCTYPLDFGGYNDGIRDRPKSYVEVLKDAGYDTFLLATANQLGVSMGYQRGFDVVGTTSDYRTLLEHRISRTMHYDIERYVHGEIDLATIIERVRKLMIPLLDGLVEAINHHDRRIWTAKLERLNRGIANGCITEKNLLATDPAAVIRKLTDVAPGLYWHYLGVAKVGGVGFFINRVRTGLSWRIRSWVAQQNIIPFLTLSHFQAIAGDVIPAMCQFVTAKRANPWLVHTHLMDLHDCRSLNRLGHVIGLARFIPRWVIGRLKGYTRRRLLYDTTLMYIDRHLAKLMNVLQPQIDAGETVLIVTGDHGSDYAERPRPKPSHGERMYYENLEVPIILAGTEKQGRRVTGFTDSMGVTRTLLDVLGVPPHQSFKSAPYANGGLDAMVAESCGRGFAEMQNGILYFATTNRKYKGFFQLRSNRLCVTRLYDRENDPKELVNVLGDAKHVFAVDELTAVLWRERGELFEWRKVDRNLKPEIVAAS